jgi:hypothetical protein
MRVAVLAVLAFLVSAQARAEWTLPEPPPADWLKQADLFGRVATMPAAQDAAVIDWTLAHQLELSSGYLFEASRRLLAAERSDEALEWYAVGMIRGEYDARRCLDTSSNRAIRGLARQAAVVARYGHTFPEQFGVAGLKALERPDLLAHTVTPDWACAQGLTGMGGQSAGTIAPNLWPDVARAVKDEYRKQFAAMSGRH